MGLATHGRGPRRQKIIEPKWLRSVSPPRGGGQGAKSERGESCEQLLFRASSPMCAALPRFQGGAFGVCDARSSLGPSRRPLLRRSSSLFSSPRRSVPWRPLRPPTPQNRPAYHGLPGGCHRAPSLRRGLLNRNGTHLLPVCHSRSYTPGRCAFRTRAAGGVAKMLDCLPFGPFWTSFW